MNENDNMSAPWPPSLLESLIGGRSQQSSLSGPGPNTVLADGTAAYVPGEVNRACDNRYAPIANANGHCHDCGQPIALHAMVPLAEWAEVERMAAERYYASTLQAVEPANWIHRLWWRVRRLWT